MKERVIGLFLIVIIAVGTLAGCGLGIAGDGVKADAPALAGVSASDIKIGILYIGDANEGYTEAHMKGIQEMKEALALEDNQVIEKTNIPEDETAYDVIVDLAEQGCNIIFANSLGHEDYMIQAASQYPDIQFCQAAGYQALSCGLPNIHNYFTAIYQSRYVSGVVAGLKLDEMIESGRITAEQAKVGYVGAYPYAEVISGYTAFFLGIRSVCESATMEVRYTHSWLDMDLEKEAAQVLIADSCVLLSQHADTTGVASVCEEKGVPIVGYNIDMIPTGPNVALTSASINWEPYYTYAVQCVINGEMIATNWSRGYESGANCITSLNEAIVAEGTKEKVEEIESALAVKTLHIFDTSTFTVNGYSLEDLVKSDEENFGKYEEYVFDGYFHESEIDAAPSFDLKIDGIRELTQN